MKYPSAIVLTEVGKFFEIWELEDLNVGHAVKASKILGITLTRRDKKNLDSPRMAGFPATSVAENYIKKLVDAGETVVVVRQTITGKKSDQNKNVERVIERIVSPGTSIHQELENKPHYFASVYAEGDFSGVCLIDLTTGEVRLSEMTKEEARLFIDNNNPLEILFCQSENFLHTKEKQILHFAERTINKQVSAGVVLSKIYDIDNPSSNNTVVLSKIGIELWPLGSLALANLLNFLVDYNPLLLKKISKPRVELPTDYMFLSKNAFLSLDIFESPIDQDESKTLYGSLNRCKTAMGRRVLRNWIQHPLIETSLIEARLDKVKNFMNEREFLEELKDVYDISRMTRRLALKGLIPQEILGFYDSLKVSRKIIKKYKGNLFSVDKVIKFVEENIDLDSVETKYELYEFFKGDLEEEVSEYREKLLKSSAMLDKRTEELSNKLETDKLRIHQSKEGIQLIGQKGLRVKLKQLGIMFKDKASDVQILDEKWDELANKDFYLKRSFLSKAEKAWQDYQTSIVDKFGEELLSFANEVGEIDVLSNFAQISYERGYSRPVIKDSNTGYINILKMRHPVVELSKELSETFIPNDLLLDNSKNIMVIYGANSAGKSTILKSLALNIIMAQIGCYIAANENSEISIFDSIMTRMTTYDSISEGLSTFTMEMIELQSALKKATERSLFLFDEIGRGTSVEDGEAIAYATLDYLNPDSTKAVTLFSTHYHKLYEKIKDYKNIVVKNISCEMKDGILTFSRKLLDGPGTGSYGLLVAKSCGIPDQIIRTADNYNKENQKLIVSRYNKSVQGTMCQLCNKEPAQETHHLIEQHQGKVKEIEVDGVKRHINDKGNLVLLCGTCHRKITKNKIHITKVKAIGEGSTDYVLKIENE